MEEEKNESAFPVVILDEKTGKPCAQELGITVRDYFAAKAMQGLVSDSKYLDRFIGSGLDKIFSTYISEESYKIADAMLKERSKS